MMLPTDVRMDKILALKGNLRPVGLCTGIGEAIAHVELCRMVHDLPKS